MDRYLTRDSIRKIGMVKWLNKMGAKFTTVDPDKLEASATLSERGLEPRSDKLMRMGLVPRAE